MELWPSLVLASLLHSKALAHFWTKTLLLLTSPLLKSPSHHEWHRGSHLQARHPALSRAFYYCCFQKSKHHVRVLVFQFVKALSYSWLFLFFIGFCLCFYGYGIFPKSLQECYLETWGIFVCLFLSSLLLSELSLYPLESVSLSVYLCFLCCAMGFVLQAWCILGMSSYVWIWK